MGKRKHESLDDYDKVKKHKSHKKSKKSGKSRRKLRKAQHESDEYGGHIHKRHKGKKERHRTKPTKATNCRHGKLKILLMPSMYVYSVYHLMPFILNRKYMAKMPNNLIGYTNLHTASFNANKAAVRVDHKRPLLPLATQATAGHCLS